MAFQEVSGKHDPGILSMAGFYLHINNRMERLMDALERVLRENPAPPFVKEVIVVQSRGMERYLALQLARRMGVAANIEYPFPGKLLQDIFTELAGTPEQYAFDVRQMTFRIMGLLPHMLGQPEFAGLKSYLSDGRRLKLYYLSREIAEVFDQYLIHRPNMPADWYGDKITREVSPDSKDAWQPVLWRALSEQNPETSPVRLLRRFETELKTGELSPEFLPPRICLFGISGLPSLHRRVYELLAEFIEIHVFIPAVGQDEISDEPADEFAGEIRGESPAVREQRNELRESMDSSGREFLNFMLNRARSKPELFRIQADFTESVTETLLARIQNDVYKNRGALDASAEEYKAADDEPDDSLQVHSCHTPFREVEVLQDRLLDIFARHPEIKPSDVAVMTPDIETYAPLIQAVFGNPESPELAIPHHIADSFPPEYRELTDTLMNVLRLARGRFTSTEVLAILESSLVMEKFELSNFDLDKLRYWVRETAIRWGLDGAHRQELGLPQNRQNTWRAGLERLLLGSAMPAEERELYDGILPYDPVEGDDAELLGRFMEFMDLLEDFHRRLKSERPLREWSALLKEITSELLGREVSEFRGLFEFFQELEELEVSAFFMEPIDLETILAHMKDGLVGGGAGYGFLRGGVTFCALMPMRGIPFKAVCLLGMNENEFPGQSRTPAFNLLYRNPEPWIPVRRNDDRRLFLETMLSARRIFYVSYVGRDIRTNRGVHPSVVVTELLNYIEKSFGNVPLIHQRLQSFHPEYFRSQGELFSFSRGNLEGARALLAEKKEQTPFLAEELAEPEDKFRRLSLPDLVSFWRGPPAFFLARRLGLYFRARQESSEETEPFFADGLESYLLREQIVRWLLAGQDRDSMMEIARARGRLPAGAPGEHVFMKNFKEAENFARNLSALLEGELVAEFDVEFELGEFLLYGRPTNLYENGLFQFRPSGVNARDLISTWIYHLAVNADERLYDANEGEKSEAKTGRPSYCVGWDSRGNRLENYRFEPPAEGLEEARRLLSELLEFYWAGLRAPLAFFPKTSYAFQEQLITAGGVGDQTRAFKEANRAWSGNFMMGGESADPANELCFRERDPLNEEDSLFAEFRNVSEKILLPLLRALSKG